LLTVGIQMRVLLKK